MPKFYPIYLNLENKTCLVVGGGGVAERKVLTLLESAAKVVVVSPQITPKLQQLANQKTINWIKRGYEDEDLEGAFLVIGATDDRRLHEKIVAQADKNNILTNIVDVPDLCNFIVPSKVERGDLCISISTSGKSPALAKKIRRQLEKQFGPEYADFLNMMGDYRGEIINKYPDGKKRKKIFEQMVDSDLLQLLKAGDKEGFEQLVQKLVGEN